MSGRLTLQHRFSTTQLDGGTKLHVLVDNKFKTTAATLVLQTTLSRGSVTRNALLPRVLRRGTACIPDTVQLERRLEELFGASLDVGVSKKGLRQLLAFQVEVAEPAYVDSEQRLFREGMELLRDMVFQPALGSGGALRDDYVEQEKENLRRLIESLIDDKQAWAMRRCIEEMFPNDDIALFKYGRAEDIGNISAADMKACHGQLVSSCPIDVFVVGACDEQSVIDDVTAVFSSVGRRVPVPPSPWQGCGADPGPNRPRFVVEAMDVNQGNLVMGFRTGLRMSERNWPALMVANGVFGRYSHSKLFQVVREREALAYSVWSMLDPTTGLLWVTAGIDFEAKDRCVELVQEELEAVKRGNVRRVELDNTLKGLARDFAVMADHPGSLIDFALEAEVNNVELSIDELSRAVAAVTLDDVAHAASSVSLDTVYFLTGEEDRPDEG
jgi:predicted Zn-dependent peptidase